MTGYKRMPWQSFYREGDDKGRDALFGLGIRGNKVFSSTTTFPTTILDYHNLTINSGVTMTLPSGMFGLIIRCTGTFTLNGTIDLDSLTPAGTGGVSHSNGGNGGDGGKGAGSILIFARNIIVSGTITATGENGAAGSAATSANYGGGGGGGGGSGGLVMLYYLNSLSVTGSVTVTKGSGGAGGNSGLPGSTNGSGAAGTDGSLITLYESIRSAFTVAQAGVGGNYGRGGGGGNLYDFGDDDGDGLARLGSQGDTDLLMALGGVAETARYAEDNCGAGSGAGGGGGGNTTSYSDGQDGFDGADGYYVSKRLKLW